MSVVLLPAVPARLTHAEATAYLQQCETAMRAAAPGQAELVTLDVSALGEFDSSALAALLGVRRSALQAGVTLQLVGLPARLRDLAALYGVSELLPA